VVKLVRAAPMKRGSVQPIEAMAYEIPNTNIDTTVRSRPPLSSLGVVNGRW
jgi:hypothetical protein